MVTKARNRFVDQRPSALVKFGQDKEQGKFKKGRAMQSLMAI
jgi:hypothetical protein